MALEHKPWRQKLTKQTLHDSKDLLMMPTFGYVMAYHPHAAVCHCDRHQGELIKKSTQNSLDVELIIHTKKQMYYDVPILERAGGLDSKPPAVGDRALMVFLQGDHLSPVVVGWMSFDQQLPYVIQAPKIIRETGFYS